VHKGAYRFSRPEIPADADLPPGKQEAAFQALEAYIQSQKWAPYLTCVEVFQGQEDSADCYLRGSEGGWLVLMVSYHYDVKDWRISAYEIPQRSFSRPRNETFEAYVARSMAEAKKAARPYREGFKEDGIYSL
jgi:hypothetical protein